MEARDDYILPPSDNEAPEPLHTVGRPIGERILDAESRLFSNIVLAGQKALDLAIDVAESSVQPEVEPLTQREKQITELIADGVHTGEVAKRLSVTKETVRSHLKHIYQKLDTNSQLELAVMLHKSKLDTIDSQRKLTIKAGELFNLAAGMVNLPDLSTAVAELNNPPNNQSLDENNIKKLPIMNIRHHGAEISEAVPEELSELTPKELDTLGVLCFGYSNTELASLFFLTEGTIKFHLNNIYQKLGVSNRTEAVHTAFRNNLLNWAEGVKGKSGWGEFMEITKRVAAEERGKREN